MWLGILNIVKEMNVKKVKIENDEGEVIHIFDSVKEAASFYGIRPEAHEMAKQ